MKVLLSIRPEHAEKIFDGTKGFEYRKSVFRSAGVSTVLVYATLPVGKVIGEFSVDEIISGSPQSVWRRTAASAGISQKFYFSYFEGRATAYAIKVKAPKRYLVPLALREITDTLTPPQSFRYLEG